jgi:hypothetical protein
MRDWRDLGDLDPETLEYERRWNAEYEMNFGSVAVLHQGRSSVHINGVARGIPLLVELLNSDGSVRTVATTSIPNDAWMQTVQLVWDENGYRISGQGEGGVAGFAKGGARVALTDGPEGGTILSYDVEANVGGKIAQLGGRLIDGVAKKNADAFFAKFVEIVTNGETPAASA